MPTTRRMLVAIVMSSCLLALSMSQAAAQAAKPSTTARTLETYRTSTSESCTNLGFLTPDPSDDRATPDGGVHCDVISSTVDPATRTLSVDTAASSATATDPTGVTAPGQGQATAIGALYFEARLTGRPAAQVHITVPVESIDTTADALGLSSAYSYLSVYAWTYNPSTSDSSWELLRHAPLPSMETASGPRSIELALAGSKLRGDLRLYVALHGASRVGTASCSDADNDGVCEPDSTTTSDGWGSAASIAQVELGTPTFVAS